MAIGNTPRRETNFQLDASKSYAFSIRFLDMTGATLDLTGATVRLVAARPANQGGSEILDLEAVDANKAEGWVQFQFQAEDLALAVGAYPYDVTLIPVSGYSTPIIKGYLEIGANTDVDTSNTYEFVPPVSEVTAVLNGGDLINVTIERIDGLYTETVQLINDFTTAMDAEVTAAQGHATAAAGSASDAQLAADELRDWLTDIGFPFWTGTMAEYLALGDPSPNVLYIITDYVP